MKKKIIILLFVIVVVVITISFFMFNKKEKIEYVTAQAKKEILIQTVSEVGMVKASQEINLNFLQTGKIAKIEVAIGDKVKKDQVLAELDYSSLTIKEQEASANLDIAQANLNKTLTGATGSEVAISQASVSQTKAAYDSALEELEKTKNTASEDMAQAEKNLADLEDTSASTITPYEQAIATARTSYNNTKSIYQQAVDNKEDITLTTIDNKLAVAQTALDNINTILDDNEADDTFSIKNKLYKTKTIDTYNRAIILLTEAENTLVSAQDNQSTSNIDKAIKDAYDVLSETFVNLSYCYSGLENSVISFSFTQTELDAYKTNISAKQTNISTAITALQTAEQNLDDARLNYTTKVAEAYDRLEKAQVDLDDAENSARDSVVSTQLANESKIAMAQTKVDSAYEAWQVAKAKLNDLKSPARIEDVALARAQVKQAEAVLSLAKKQIEESIIKAPIEGTVIKIEYEIGEQVVSTKPAISMLGNNNFEIEVDVSEADIAKVNISNKVEITLDAYGEDKKFFGQVYFIEPAETVIQDVIYYKVKIKFIDNEEKLTGVKSGMTANTVITTAEKKNVLTIPTRAIVEKNGDGKYARILVDGEMKEAQIKIGLRGDGGLVEILSGVKEGDEVVTYVKNGK